MYKQGYGIIKTLAPLHVGATAGEESGNLNLIFRDQFTQTGIIPSSSIRGRLRSDMYHRLLVNKLKQSQNNQEEIQEELEQELKKQALEEVSDWYGRGAEKEGSENYDYESLIKPEHASVVWLPVFCPGQPIVWVSCPRLLARYRRIANINIDVKLPEPYTGSKHLKGKKLTKGSNKDKEVLFFNLGFLTVDYPNEDLKDWFPLDKEIPAIVVDDNDMAMIHDMALYRQSRVSLEPDKKVASQKAFFNVEALPEETLLVFPIAMKETKIKNWQNWKPLDNDKAGEIYLGGLESVGFGHCSMTIKEV